MAASAKEVFNNIHEEDFDSITYFKRGGNTKMYYGLAPVICLNMGTCAFKSYGDEDLPRPLIYITDHEYIWWPGTRFSLE